MKTLILFAVLMLVLPEFTVAYAQMNSMRDVAEEVVTRIKTERLSNQEKYDLIVDQAKALSLNDRLEYDGLVLRFFKDLKLPESFEILLFKNAIDDAGAASSGSARSALVEAVADWCGTHQADQQTIAHEFLSALFNFNNLSIEDLKNITRFFTFHRRSESETPDPDFEFVLSNVMRNPAVDKEFARYYLFEDLISFKAPLLARSRLLTQLVAKNILPDDLSDLSREYAKQLKHSDMFLNKFANNSTLDDVLGHLEEGDNAIYLLKAAQKWMGSRQLSRDDRSKVYSLIVLKADQLLGGVEDHPRTLVNDFVRSIRQVILIADVDDAVRRALVDFVLRHTTSPSEASERERYLIASMFIYNFDNRPFWMSPITQDVLESLVKTTKKALPVMADDPNRQNEDGVIRIILDALELCQNDEKASHFGFDNAWCKVLSSPSHILDLVLENKNIDQRVRDYARSLKH